MSFYFNSTTAYFFEKNLAKFKYSTRMVIFLMSKEVI